MKYPILPLFTVLLLISSCTQEPSNAYIDSFEPEGYQSSSFVAQNSMEASQPEANSSSVQASTKSRTAAKIIWYPVKDAKTGMVSSKIPMPSSWKVKTATQEDPSNINGPQGFKGFTYPGQTYLYTQDQYMSQMYSQSGMQMRAPIDVATLVERELIGPAQQQGFSVVSKYHLPDLAAHDRNYASQLYGSQNFQSQYDAYVTEWKDTEGKPSMSIVRYYSSTSMGMTYWGYTVVGMEADPSYFEQAKSEYINALVKTQYNPAHIAQHNASEKAKEQQSWSQHNQRMATNQQNFDASQQAYRTRQEASDIQMQGWRNNNAIQEQGHSNHINSINETQVVTDYNNGQRYQVEAGANQTWMNGNGEYIQTDDYNYNPNTDPNANQHNWEDTGGGWDD